MAQKIEVPTRDLTEPVHNRCYPFDRGAWIQNTYSFLSSILHLATITTSAVFWMEKFVSLAVARGTEQTSLIRFCAWVDNDKQLINVGLRAGLEATRITRLHARGGVVLSPLDFETRSYCPLVGDSFSANRQRQSSFSYLESSWPSTSNCAWL